MWVAIIDSPIELEEIDYSVAYQPKPCKIIKCSNPLGCWRLVTQYLATVAEECDWDITPPSGDAIIEAFTEEGWIVRIVEIV